MGRSLGGFALWVKKNCNRSGVQRSPLKDYEKSDRKMMSLEFVGLKWNRKNKPIDQPAVLVHNRVNREREKGLFMRKVHSFAQVDQAKCIGDRICENICMTGAIRVINKKAVVDEHKCVACQKCIDYCEEGAIQLVPRSQPLVLRVDLSEVDQDQLEKLCRKAHLHPDDVICPCTATTASEVGAAILKGAKTPEDISLMTGVRTACGMWCMCLVQEMLRAHGLKTTPPKGYTWYEVDTALWTIPDEVMRKYPEYRLDEARRLFEERMENQAPKES